MEHPQKDIRQKSNLYQIKRQKVVKSLIIIIFFAVFALIIYHPIKNLAVSKMIRYETAQWKVLEQSTLEEAVVIRDETLIVSPGDGIFEPIVFDGEKVGAGQIIGYVTTQGGTDKVDSLRLPVKAPIAGLVTYYSDGLEEVLRPDLLNKLDMKKISGFLEGKREPVSTFPKAERGKAVCKITDNLVNPFLYIPCSGALASFLMEKGDELSVRFADGNTARVILRDIKKDEKQTVFMFEIFDAPDISLGNRFIPVNIITDRYEGVVVLAEALVKENGQDGVFVSRKGICTWVKVEVKGYVHEKAAVSGLDAGSQYIANPAFVYRGQRIN